MCGIAGIMFREGKSPDASILESFARALGHRGPDGEGKYLAGPVAMVHTRLAVIDLKTGDQPIYESGGAALIANAEIYNHLELRKLTKNFQYNSNSDTETLLALYQKYGENMFDFIDGMFAFVIIDKLKNQI